MESKDKLKEIDPKNCTCFYLLLDEKLYKEKYENTLISYKTSMGARSLRIRFDKKDGFVQTCNGIRCLLFDVYYII